MKKLLTGAILLLVLAATAANVNWSRSRAATDEPAIEKDSVVITGDTLMLDSLTLSLKEIPKAQHLYTVAKVSVGRWAKLFTAIKLEESGADGKNSYYARAYNNLTGMRWPGKGRQTTAVSVGKGNYAIFNHWHDCMVDWKLYIELMDVKFQEKYGRVAKDELEMIDFMYGSYNPYKVWKQHMYWHINHFKYK